MEEQLLDTWHIHNRVNLYLLEAVKAEALKAVFGCDVAILKPGEDAEGDLDDATCKLDDGRFVAYYAFASEPEDAAYAVEAASAWFYTVLGLYDDKGEFLAENDDLGPFDTNSRLDVELKRGVYVAAVSSFDASTGPYRVSVSE